MSTYLRVLGFLYVIGGVLSLTQIFGLGGIPWAEMWLSWKTAAIFYGLLGILAGVGLILEKPWGVSLFLFIAFSELILYSVVPGMFAYEPSHWVILQAIIAAHIITLVIYFVLRMRDKRG